MRNRRLFMVRSPKLAGKARRFGRNYAKIAVVEVEPGFEGEPAMISNRARGVVRIVECKSLHIGSTPRSYGFMEWQRMEKEVDDWNANLGE